MATTLNYESLKLFYVGKQRVDGEMQPMVYENKDLLTHAAIIGMTGSGKTGLGITLLEEAAIDNIPSIIIDPKGDMTNLLLAFPDMQAVDFMPWIDDSEAVAAGVSVAELAEKKASLWRQGIERDFQPLERVAKYRQAADFTIYTPASDAGIKVSILSSFKAPAKAVQEDFELFVSIVGSMVASIFALMGDHKTDANARESVLLNSVFMHHFQQGEDLTLESLVHEVLNPPFDKVGVFDLETFFPQSERLKFSLKLNGLIANPAFRSWIEGMPLDISSMLYDEQGKAKVNIFTISHLSDAQRMFFVTILLNEILSWMRRQEGTTSLKALLYMDEIFGYFPPTANPPSKEPMLTLLKQARSFGIGIVLSTQNPVDIDYKGLANIGSWFIGRLQTKQDIARVIDGLSSANSAFDKQQIADMITNLDKRQFILNNVNNSDIEVFETRWALSYLKGPIPKEGIQRLMADKRQQMPIPQSVQANAATANSKPLITPALAQSYLYRTQNETPSMQPYLTASAQVRYVNASKQIDDVEQVHFAYYLRDEMKQIDFNDAETALGAGEQQERRGAHYYDVPAFVLNEREVKSLERDFSDYLYRHKKLTLYKNDAFKLHSKEGESLVDFRLRLQDRLHEKVDAEVDKLKDKFRKDNDGIEQKLVRLQERLSGAQAKASAGKMDAIISIGSSILGGLLGSRRASSGAIASGTRNAAKLMRGSEQVKLLETDMMQLQQQQDALQNQLQADIARIQDTYRIDQMSIDETYVNPRRTDIFDIRLGLLWVEV